MRKLNVPQVTSDPITNNQTQDILDQLRRLFKDVAFLNGREISGYNLNTGDNHIIHGLGRAWQGYVILSRSNGAVIFDKVVSGFPKEQYLTLNASASVLVKLWVF
jgi:hypothetical protein